MSEEYLISFVAELYHFFLQSHRIGANAMAKSVAAFHCVQATGYLRAMNMAEPNGTQCSVGEAFFGELSTLETGSFILNTSNGLYLPASACQELTWICVAPSGVACRHSADLADKSESMVQHGNRISAIMVPGVAGWLQEAATKMYVPMNHPATGDPLFTKVDANNPQVTPQISLSGGSR
eukprot:s841_g9.t1